MNHSRCNTCGADHDDAPHMPKTDGEVYCSDECLKLKALQILYPQVTWSTPGHDGDLFGGIDSTQRGYSVERSEIDPTYCLIHRDGVLIRTLSL